MSTTDWMQWHRQYDDPASALSRRRRAHPDPGTRFRPSDIGGRLEGVQKRQIIIG